MRPVSPRRQTLADLISTLIVLCRGHFPGGAPFWAYLALRPEDAARFHDARSKGTLNLEEFGTILEWGEGEQPPEEVSGRMRAQYGIQEDFEKALLAAVKLHG